jgi:DNA-binding MarR family transcriptional regulator
MKYSKRIEMEQIATLETQIKEFNKMVDRSQTSINHLKTFSAICQSYPITSADLAIKMDLKNSTLNRLLHSLAENSRGQTEAAELIEIEMDVKDKRQRNINLTPKGKSLMKKMFGAKK